MRTINRSAFIVRPKEPYLRWAASLDTEAPEQAESLVGRASVYLVPEPTEEGEAETPPIEEYFEEIFEEELTAWWTDESDWPKERNLTTFFQWFEVFGESVIGDLAEDRFGTRSKADLSVPRELPDEAIARHLPVRPEAALTLSLPQVW